MADILISKFTTQIPRVGATPATPGFAESEGQDPVAPSGSPLVYTPVTIGSPANGLSISGTQVLTIGLASTSATGALSSTDWNTFNGKIGGSLTSGRIPFATGASTLSDDSGLTWDNATKSLTAIGQQIFQGSTASDTAPLGTELATTGSGTNWTGSDFATGYTHVVGSIAPLTTSTPAVSGTFYQIAYNVTGRTAGSFTINYGGTSTAGLTATGATGPRASSTANLEIVPTTDFDGTIVLSIRSIGASSATTTFSTSGGAARLEIRSSSIATNSFIGNSAGRRNTTGANNTFFGSGAGSNNTTASFNTYFGTNAGLLSTGQGNSIFGFNAGAAITTGSGNSIFGGSAGIALTTGVNNMCFGSLSGTNITTSSDGIFFGVNSGRFLANGTTPLTSASNSLFIGSNTRANANNETNQIVIGHTAIGGGSNTTTIGNSSTVSTRLPAGSLWVNTTSGTNTLDVNGTARIRTISNLGSAATSVLVPSATGVVSLRTLAELASDGGLVTITGTQTITGVKTFSITSSVSIQNSATIALNAGYTGALRTDALIGTNSTAGTGQNLNTPALNSGGSFASIATTSGYNVGIRAIAFGSSSVNIGFYGDTTVSGTGNNIGFYARAGNSSTRNVSGYLTSSLGATIPTISKNTVLLLDSAIASLPYLVLQNTGSVGFEITDLFDFSFSSTNGSKLGTSSTQKIGFYGATPIVRPSGDILTALSNLGLIASPTITQIDQFAVKTTASADQTLPSGVLTILDYDTTLTNNSTATYTVGTTGRITINTTGIYTITAGVVIEADAVTALESAFLGIFRNGDLVAISSINTTIAAGAQSGLSTSTILSLTATDIIDCRALVNSVGGVANGLARRLGTLLGANATQVNSLSITKNSM